jgi:hypothetical protein
VINGDYARARRRRGKWWRRVEAGGEVSGGAGQFAERDRRR